MLTPHKRIEGVDTSDIYNLDVKSETFKNLPANLQYDVLRSVDKSFLIFSFLISISMFCWKTWIEVLLSYSYFIIIRILDFAEFGPCKVSSTNKKKRLWCKTEPWMLLIDRVIDWLTVIWLLFVRWSTVFFRPSNCFKCLFELSVNCLFNCF